ncbi:hypothetical protein BIW11_07049 [Tropilaelaps mercedesae]|uniref:Uncharacterized protein n=1 Tax=Tropilaelaps mercedesae TaxID=418985 RepID=A0A1V9XVH2_9ACAR|nr:hypothetical protein BIW11_07049 [Tropilaelaps mercedesae]
MSRCSRSPLRRNIRTPSKSPHDLNDDMAVSLIGMSGQAAMRRARNVRFDNDRCSARFEPPVRTTATSLTRLGQTFNVLRGGTDSVKRRCHQKHAGKKLFQYRG